MMDIQTAFNILLSLVSFLGVYVLNSLRDNIKALQSSDNELSEKVQNMEVLVAGSYIKREELDKLMHLLFAKLDRIEAKLDTKVDK